MRTAEYNHYTKSKDYNYSPIMINWPERDRTRPGMPIYYLYK